MILTHAEDVGNPEFTLCGDAYDIDALGDEEVPAPIFAKRGEVVTCKLCRRVITECKSYSRGFRKAITGSP